jgi:tetratricopeptide (TPR) repeat protein
MRVIVTHTQLEKPGLPARDGGAVDADALSRRNGAVAACVRGTDAVDASERHPIFLCDKGDTLAAAGAWDAAENAFSAALKLQPSADTAASGAPSLLARALRGRATCRRHLGDDAGAVADLEAAVLASMDSHAHSEWRSAVDAELAAARADCLLTPDELRQRGDALAGAGQVDDALSLYRRALARGGLRVQVAVYTNRAALWLKQGQLAAAESDVQAAFHLVFGSTDVAGDAVVTEVLEDTERARQCGGGAALSRLLARRAGIMAKQHRFADAAADARAAAALRRRDGELDVAAALEADAARWAVLLT